MATIAFDYTKALQTLAPTFQTAVKATVEQESQPIKNTQKQKDAVTIQRSMYADMKSNLDGLQSAVQSLISTQASFGLALVSKPTVLSGTAGATVVTGTTSDTAVTGDYDIAVTHLAKAESKASEAAPTADIALGKSGIFWMGGTGTAAVQTQTAPGVFSAFVPSDSLTAANTSVVADGQRELGSGAYSLQVRVSDGVRQFRLVNADGTAVSIKDADGSGSTSAWQKMNDGSYDTGRGMTFSLNSQGSLGSTALDYTAMGTSINISATDTQRTIANTINAAVQPEGHDFNATIVGGKLVLTGKQTGVNHAMIFSDGANLGFGADLQTAQNAEFTINGMSVSRATNSNLADVMDGVTLNLAGDAEGKTAKLSITGTTDKAASAMSNLVSKFNAAFTYLTGKMATTSTTTGSTTKYSRGPLASDTVFKSLRTDLYDQMSRGYTNAGSFKNLADIGLSFDKDMKLTLDDKKFIDAIQNHSTDLTAFLDTAMGRLNTTLSHHTGTTGSLQISMNSMDNQIKGLDIRISSYNESITRRQQSLIESYQAMQYQLSELGFQAQQFGINISGIATGSITNSNLNLLA